MSSLSRKLHLSIILNDSISKSKGINLYTITDSSPPRSLSHLPDKILLNCFACVSRLYYPTLSLVSKKFRSLLASPALYNIRKLLNRTESCLYLLLQNDPPRWFTLCRRPTRVLNPNPNPNPKSQCFNPCFKPFRIQRKKERKPSENLLVSIPYPSRHLSLWLWNHIATLDHNIYTIGVKINGKPTSRVFVMDCRSHTCREAPSMRIARKCPKVSVLDGKIYVVESCNDNDESNLMEVFDPKTQNWDYVPSPIAEIRLKYIYATLVINENLYLFGDKHHVVYKPKENRWDVVEWDMGLVIRLNFYDGYFGSCCVVDNVVYCYNYERVIEWYDFERKSWRVLKGLEGLPKLPKSYGSVGLVNNGGKLAVLWAKSECVLSCRKMIWCAEIALERRRGVDEIFGKVVWCDGVREVPRSWILIRCFIAARV
ncbi:unnamed protein product [Cochlearia groenlandica]